MEMTGEPMDLLRRTLGESIVLRLDLADRAIRTCRTCRTQPCCSSPPVR
jgi:hypothetical protein